MINKVIATAEKYKMLPNGAKIVVAVSGGSDSMALLHVLMQLKERYNLTLTAAHVNHGLRGADADADEAFVVDYCKANDIPVKTLRAEVSRIAAEKGMSFEETGRAVRYDFFNSFGDDIFIATAHNANDRAETFLFNFTRGSTLRGLCSIPAVRGNIIRPIIDCSKSEILDYCKANSIVYVTDKTNNDVAYSRNRIRHNVITELSEINPSFEASASRCLDSLREDEEFLSSLAAELVKKVKKENGYDAELLSLAEAPVLKRALVMICEKEKSVTPEHTAVNELCGLLKNGGKTVISGNVAVRVRKGYLDFPDTSQEPYEPVELKAGENVFYGFSVKYDIVNKEETINLQNLSKEILEYLFDYDKIVGKVVLRSRLPGDKINLKSRGCTKSLKKLFNELEIPPEKRNRIIIVSDDAGILAVTGVGVDARAAVTNKTEKMLYLSISEK